MSDIVIFGYTVTPQFIIANLIGFVAVFFSMFSFQRKDNKGLFAMQLVSAALFGTHYLILGAYSGAAFNVVACIRGYMLCKGGRFAEKKWCAVIVAMCTAVFAAVLIFFHEWTAAFSFTAMALSTLSMWSGKGKTIRLVQLCIISPCWIAFNILTASVAGAITECLTIISIIISIARYGINGFETKK